MVAASAAAAAQPTVVWEHDKFFEMTTVEEHAMKIRLASALGPQELSKLTPVVIRHEKHVVCGGVGVFACCREVHMRIYDRMASPGRCRFLSKHGDVSHSQACWGDC